MDSTNAPDPSPGFLTALPLWARHLLLLLVPGLVLAAGLVLRAVVDAGGVLAAVDWPATGAAVVAGLAGWGLLVLTPLERRYGVASTPQTRALTVGTDARAGEDR